jgi:hypothetical protein
MQPNKDPPLSALFSSLAPATSLLSEDVPWMFASRKAGTGDIASIEKKHGRWYICAVLKS